MLVVVRKSPLLVEPARPLATSGFATSSRLYRRIIGTMVGHRWLSLLTIMLFARSLAFTARRTVFRYLSRAMSVTGDIYTDDKGPLVTLFTKADCSLCDTVKAVLDEVRETHPHSLTQMDITDNDQARWWQRYKYDIPVLHVNGQYWSKHRLTIDQARQGLAAAQDGTFTSPPGEPNAAAMERKQ